LNTPRLWPSRLVIHLDVKRAWRHFDCIGKSSRQLGQVTVGLIIGSMAILNAAADVQELLSSIREFIHHPRRLDPLLRDKPAWNMLACAMDVVSDTEWAITSYERGEYADKGMLYLVLYGLLQAMYVQQDALQNLVRALEGNDQYKIANEPEAELIRRVRHDTIGHPTKQGGIKAKKDGGAGEQISHSIVQHALNKEGFTLLRASNLTASQFIDYRSEMLIAQNRAVTARVLTQTKKRLEDIEMEHRKTFKGEKLISIFPSQMGYYFEKIYAAIHNPSYGHGPMGEFGLQTVIDTFTTFKAALDKRGILNESSHIHYELDETEYPLVQLSQYFKGAGLLTDPRAASIFAHFAQHKMKELLRIAEEIDCEYEGDLAAEGDEPAHIGAGTSEIRVTISGVDGSR
jgi:hypothetical protein